MLALAGKADAVKLNLPPDHPDAATNGRVGTIRIGSERLAQCESGGYVWAADVLYKGGHGTYALDDLLPNETAIA
jgi:hypothetical protein